MAENKSLSPKCEIIIWWSENNNFTFQLRRRKIPYVITVNKI